MLSLFIMPKRRTFGHFLASSVDIIFFWLKRRTCSPKEGRMVILYNRNFRRNLLKSSVKVNVDYKELKTSVHSGNEHLNKQLQEKWFQFMQQMPATDFKGLSLGAKNVLGTRTRRQTPVLVLEVNHRYSYSFLKILKASTRYSYSKVEYSTPSSEKGNC